MIAKKLKIIWLYWLFLIPSVYSGDYHNGFYVGMLVQDLLNACLKRKPKSKQAKKSVTINQPMMPSALQIYPLSYADGISDITITFKCNGSLKNDSVFLLDIKGCSESCYKVNLQPKKLCGYDLLVTTGLTYPLFFSDEDEEDGFHQIKWNKCKVELKKNSSTAELIKNRFTVLIRGEPILYSLHCYEKSPEEVSREWNVTYSPLTDMTRFKEPNRTYSQWPM